MKLSPTPGQMGEKNNRQLQPGCSKAAGFNKAIQELLTRSSLRTSRKKSDGYNEEIIGE